uniref:Uncharacterized protein n=1 Tax=Arundo donax TaxID=35708 RepID=A0A0A9EZ03_ARUDO
MPGSKSANSHLPFCHGTHIFSTSKKQNISWYAGIQVFQTLIK